MASLHLLYSTSMIRHFCVLALFAVLPPTGSGGSLMVQGQDIPAEITIGTWNLEWFYDHDQGDNQSKLSKEKSAPSADEWEWKLNGVAKVIGQNRPYIMALQEVENRKVIFDLKNKLRSEYDLNYRIGFVEGFDTFTEQDVAILFRDGLVEVSRKEQNAIQWKSKKYKNLSKHLFARFEWGQGAQKEELVILNLHLRAMPDRENLRIQQGRLARLWIDEEVRKHRNVVVLGDFNTEHPYGRQKEDSDVGVLRGLDDNDAANDFKDSHASISENERSTHLTGKQFDRILFSPALATDESNRRDLVFDSARIARKMVIRGSQDAGDQRWENVYAIPQAERDISDHYPLFAKFLFK